MYGEGSGADKHHENPLYDVVKEKAKDEAEEWQLTFDFCSVFNWIKCPCPLL